ncbi:MAG: efflux RND transporter permease subunit [Candidatus Paceibacterota bacterium]|jgi:HAE1 family hydrophobic/amphiphilic exporter-1
MSSSDNNKSIWNFFIDNFRLTYVVIFTIIVFGIVSILTIPKESSPEVDLPIVVISTSLPGASAIDVEELITDKIENRIQGLADIDTFTSTSQQSLSSIVITFNIGTDIRDKLSDVRERIDRVKPDLPLDTNDPVIQQISFDDRPILSLALSGPFDPIRLKEYAEELKESIERVEAVSQISITGAPEREIQIILSDKSLSQFGLNIGQVTSGIVNANSDIPIGSIETAGSTYTVRLEGRLHTAEDVRNTAIASSNGTPVFIRDIAEVEDTYTRSNTISRLGTHEGGINQSIGIEVFKLSGQGDILTIVDKTNEIITEARENTLPEEIIIEVVQDDAEFIRKDLSTLLNSGLLTMIIVLIVLIIFLGWKEALLASLVVPLTFLFTFAILNPLGYTINFLTLFSLILALGILVDASIVVTENMFNLLKEGKSPYQSAIETITEFKNPLISGTLTTVFVFLPMLLMSGIIGEFIESIPITITIVLLTAIFVSLGIITTLGIHLLKPSNNSNSFQGLTFTRDLIKKLYAFYDSRLHLILNNPKYSKRFLIIIIVLFLVSISLPVFGILEVNMFPPSSMEIIYIDVENPVGTPLSVTNAQIMDIEDFLIEDMRIESFMITVGSGSSFNTGSIGQSAGHVGSVVVNLREETEIDSIKLIEEYEPKLNELVPDAIVTLAQEGAGPPSGLPVQVKIMGKDIEDLEETAKNVADILYSIEGTRNVSDGIQEGPGELFISINRAQARMFGVSPVQIAGLLRTAITGNEATVVKVNGDDINVKVIYNIGSSYGIVGNIPKVSVSDLNSILIPTEKGMTPLSTFANVSLTNNRVSISHEDGDRSITVSSDIKEGANAGLIVKQLQEKIENYNLPENVSIKYGGEEEDINESFASLGQAMILGIILIFGLLLWQFNSFRQPFFIIITIPLALIGVFFGLVLMNQPLSFPGFIGIVALAGIVVNNAIILIDSINKFRKEGLTIIDAVYVSAKSRLQPILLTTLTTVAGMLPLAFSDPTWAPVALSIIFGLLFSTILTLFVVPILYVKFGKKEIVV